MTTTPWPKAICFSLISPLITCNLSNLALYCFQRCYKARSRRHETSKLHAAYETSTPVVYTWFIEVSSLIFEFLDF